ncbi:MAG: Ig-like domain-containing protein [Patescibacteria group bacterium]
MHKKLLIILIFGVVLIGGLWFGNNPDFWFAYKIIFQPNARVAGVQLVVDTSAISIINPANGVNFLVGTVPVVMDITNTTSVREFLWNWNNQSYTIYNNSLVAMFNFDNITALGESLSSTTVTDASLYANKGTCTNLGTGCPWATGKYGQAMNFTGTTGNILINTSSSLNALSRHTVELWVNSRSNSLLSTIFNKMGEGEGFRITKLSDGRIAYDLANGRGLGATQLISNQAIPINIWTHIVVAYDGTVQRMYINGALQSGSINTTAFVSNTFSPLEIGYASCCGILNGYNGLLDEVKVWNRALSVAEIQQAYASALRKYDTNKWSFESIQTNLSSGTYTLSASVTDTLGNTNSSSIQTITVNSSLPADTQSPSTPTGLTITTISSSQLNLAWAAATDNVGVAGYRIYRGGSQIGTSNTASYSNTGLTAATTYSYTVSAYDAAGNISSQSASVSGTTQSVLLSGAIIVDHASVDRFSQIPASVIQSARNLRSLLRHASVGGNINDGLNDLYNQNTIYNRNQWSFQNRGNDGGVAKINDFISQVQIQSGNYDIFAMKFCFIDIDVSTLYAQYRDAMLQLERNYPNKKFVWWTQPLRDGGPPAQVIQAFNNNVRSYAAQNNKILYDIAAIESHRADGTLCTSNGYEVPCTEWSRIPDGVSDGSHLGVAGRQRAAKAHWYLMARLTGWSPDSLSIDTQSPSTPTGLTVTPISSSQLNLSWTASTDSVGVVGYRIYRSGTQIGISNTTSYSNTGLTAVTTYSYAVSAYDAAGNISSQSAAVSGTTRVVASDIIAPVVSVIAPVSGFTASGTITLSASATDNVGVASVQFRVAGLNVGSEDTVSPYSISWNSASMVNGSHLITAVARDAAGNSAVSLSVSIIVSNTIVAVNFKNVNHTYPRIGLLQWGGGNVDWFCRYDLVMLPEVETYKARQMQTRCPSTYMIATNDWTQGGIFQPPGHADVLPDVWYQKQSTGVRVPTGTRGMMNFTKYTPKYTGYISSPAFVDFEMPTSIYIDNKTYTEAISDAFLDYVDWSAWDGINSDGSWPFPYNSGDIDLNGNGINDWPENGCAVPCTSGSTGFEQAYLAIQKEWIIGNEALVQSIRDKMQQKLGGQKIITYWTISNSDPAHGSLMNASLVNGVGWEMASYMPGTNWNNFIRNNAAFNTLSRSPKINWVNSTILGDEANAPVGNPKNYFRFMRYMLTQTLRGDNYFMQEDGGRFLDRVGWNPYNEHYWQNWYDEFDTNLGYPTGSAQSLGNGTWIRFFDNGVSITNPTTATQTVTDTNLRTLAGYSGPYYRFRGNQDPTWNNGQLFSSVTLISSAAAGSVSPVGDGILLFRTPTTVVSDVIIDNAYTGTSPGSPTAVMTGFSWDEAASVNYKHPSYYVGWRTDGDSITHKQHYASAGSGSATAVFRPTINVPGQYRVYEWHGWYGVNQTNMEATNVPASIVHSGGTANLAINQRVNPGQWNLLGTYSFNNTHASVTITNNANGYVLADAFKFVYAGSTNSSDTTPPTISIASPVANQFFTTNSAAVSGTAFDNTSVSLVRVRVNGGTWQTASGTASWNVTLALSSGSNIIEAQAIDGSTLNSAIQSVNVIYNVTSSPVDTTLPIIFITAPTSNQIFSTSTITVSGTASDNMAVSSVRVRVNGSAWQTATGTTSWHTTLTLSSGSNIIELQAIDSSELISTIISRTVIYQILDTVSPEVSITEPLTDSIISGSNVTISATATDNVGVVGVQFQLNGTNLGTELAVNPYTINWDTTGAIDKTYTLIAVARDAAGNQTVSSAISFIVKNIIPVRPLLEDEILPIIIIYSPKTGSIVSNIITLFAKAFDNVGVADVQFKLNGVDIGNKITTSPYTIKWDTTQSTNGQYPITAVASDAVGNKATSTSVIVVVNNIPIKTTGGGGGSITVDSKSNIFIPAPATQKNPTFFATPVIPATSIAVVAQEKLVSKAIDTKLTNRLKGRILLQVENHGYAWYLDPKTGKRFYLKDGNTAYTALQAFGLGISNENLAKIPVSTSEQVIAKDSDSDDLDDQFETAIGTDPNNKDTDGDSYEDGMEVASGYSPLGAGKPAIDANLVKRLEGRIILAVNKHGEAFYISNGIAHYLKDGASAYQIMRNQSLGITNDDLRKIQVGEFE